MQRLTVLGGGTGSYTILKSLKNLNVAIDSIVNMSDNGGSSGVLRDELGVLPPGDIRQCLVALSSKLEIRQLFNYRFQTGSLSGQSLGNIILSGLSLQYDSFSKAVEIASEILQIKGRVIPVTLQQNQLVLSIQNKIIIGEHKINNYHFNNHQPQLTLKPKSSLNPIAKNSILNAKFIVIAPGNIFCSIVPIFLVDQIKQTIHQSQAKIILLINLMNNFNHTNNWHVQDYINQFQSLIKPKKIDFVVYNNNLPSKLVLKNYAKENEFPVRINQNDFKNNQNIQLIATDLLSNEITIQDPADLIPRTLIRHDGRKVLKIIKPIIALERNNYKI